MIKVFVLNNENKYIDKFKKYIKNIDIKILNLSVIENEIKLDKKNKLYYDYLRIYTIYKNSGIILDGKIELKENLDAFFENEVFFGFKTENEVATNILYSKEKNNIYLKQMLDLIKSNKYESITDVLSEVTGRNLKNVYNSLVNIDNKLYIYPYDYFYPLDYEKHGKNISENTKIIFHEKLPLSKFSRIKYFLYKKYGPYALRYLLTLMDIFRNKLGAKRYIKKQSKGEFNDPKVINESVMNSASILDSYKKKKVEYVIFHNPRWMGVTSSTKELFDNLVPLQGIYNSSQVDLIARKVIELNVKQVIFSAFEYGFDNMARKIKELNHDIKIKLFWHSSHSQINGQLVDIMNWKTNLKVIKLYRKGIIDVFGTCKESLFNFYKLQGFNTAFIKNTVRLDENTKNKIIKLKEITRRKNENNEVKVGLYAAGMDWRKNMFNQIAATSLIPNVILDSVPLNFEGEVFASKIGLKMTGVNNGVKRDELLKRMASNSINLYVTFSECAPMLPIESMECKTLCLTGDNHHYFKNTELEKYLVVSREDDVIAISDKIKFALDNEEKIFKLYDAWKKEYDIESEKSVKDFLKI